MDELSPKWTNTAPPPEGHEDVARFAWELFGLAKREKERLLLPERWIENHRLYRGDHWPTTKHNQKNKRSRITINLFFANVQRTTANLTAREPVAEVVALDISDGTDKIFNSRLLQWYKETEQQKNLVRTCNTLEIYGISVEKAVWDARRQVPDIVVVDPFAIFPAPGNYETFNECPFVAHAIPMQIEEVEKLYGVKGVEADDLYSLLGEDREENVAIPAGRPLGSDNYPGNYTNTQYNVPRLDNYRERRALVVEVWLRDFSRVKERITEYDEYGVDVEVEIERLKYPGGIRVVTITNNGKLLLDDKPNPNVNLELPPEMTTKTYLHDHYPFYFANSYEDTTSIWGFSAAEQVGDLNYRIDEMMSRISSYINRVCLPPLILPKDCGISRQRVNNLPGLVLAPSSSHAAREIRYLQVPNLPSNFFDVLNLYMSFFDRVYQIEDADRGEAPRGVIAASAIMALQERNAVLIRQKIRSVDFLVRERGRCAISFFQNFGTGTEVIDVQGEPQPFNGTEMIGRNFAYVVESGSTMPRTSLQVVEDAKMLYQMGAIDRQALLEALKFPGANEILERVGEGQVNQALQILAQAGVPAEALSAIQNVAMEHQGGPSASPQGGLGKPGAPPQAGVPKQMQGERAA